MTCLETQEQISRYVDHELGDQEAAVMFLHAGTCMQCREFFSELMLLQAGLADEKEVQRVPTPPWRAVGKRKPFPAASALPRSAWLRSRRVSLPLPVAAVLGLLLLVTSALITRATLVQSEPKEVILMSLPTVEVQGYRLSNQPVQQ